MPRLFLHIGTHKTGTTSIQRFCSSNREALRKLGVWYPPADLGAFDQHYAHHHVAHAIAGRHATLDAADAAEFFDRLRRQAGRNEVCVVSAEPMYRHVIMEADPPTGRKATTAERNERYRRYADAVRSAIGDFDVTVMVMLRRQDLFAESLYAEQVMATAYQRPIERFVAEKQLLLDYETRLATWADVFGEERISIRVFEPRSMQVPIERSFVEWVGADWDDSLRIGERRNVTLTRTFVEFKRLLNRRGQTVTANNQLRGWIERLSETADPSAVPDLGRYYLQPRDRAELLERYAAGNQAVAERYLNGEALFDTDLTALLADYADRPSLGRQDVVHLTQALVQMLADTETRPPN